jgi:hypothetical protein
MALHSLGTVTNTSLIASAAWTGGVTSTINQDLGKLNFSVTSDLVYGLGGLTPSSTATILQGYTFGVTAVLAQATVTNATTSLTAVTTIGPSSNAITQVAAGDVVLGKGVPAGTYVVSATSNSVVMSQNATTTTTGNFVAFVRQNEPGMEQAGVMPNGLLYIPNRGWLKVLPGDYVAIDNFGWPILVSGNSVALSGSIWTFT